MEVYPQHKSLFSKDHSTDINELPKIVRTLESSKHLRSLVSGASFHWSRRNNATTRQEVLDTLGLIGTSIRRLHYAPAGWDPNIHNLPVTSVSTPYPASSRLDDTARKSIYSLFSVPTLRHLTLYGFQDVFVGGYSYSDLRHLADHLKGREKTSNVEFLSIQDTASDQFEDLREIMRWPKALKGFECIFGLKEAYSEEYPWDTSILVRVLQPQHASLEQISADFRDRESTAGTLGTSLSNFPKLKRLSVPRRFLVRLDGDPVYYIGDGCDENDYLDVGMSDLHLTLPPALEELVLNIDGDVKWLEKGERPHPDFKELIKKVAMHKQELYPSLKRMVLWKSCDLEEFTPEEIDVQEKEMIDILEFSDLFKSVGVDFLYQVSHVAPSFQNPYL